MSFATVSSVQVHLLKTSLVRVEVDLSKGLNAFSIVGLPDKAVAEAKDRISAAIKNTGFKSPKQKNHKIVISLAPADTKKEGPSFDLPMAVGYLIASKCLPADVKGKLFVGELSLDGMVQGIDGVLPIVREAKRSGFKEVYVPLENAKEAALIDGIDVYGVKNLWDLSAHLTEKDILPDDERPFIQKRKMKPFPLTKFEVGARDYQVDFADVKGQRTAKRGLEIAAAGGHNIAMWGPPGTGKTLLAKAFISILPPLDIEQALEVTGIHSVAGALQEPLITYPPLRAPHHTASYIALVGGGAIPKPGEITLAHRGVLFLDEFPEFDRRVIDALRQPLEDHVVSIARVKGSAQFPAHFTLITAMNPCPCGNNGVKGKTCSCAQHQIDRYKRKISGPIVDRIDLWTEVSVVEHEKLTEGRGSEETSEQVRSKVAKARAKAEERYKKLKLPFKTNSDVGPRDIATAIPLSDDVKKALNLAAKKHDLSARSYHRLIKLARTVADLEGHDDVTTDDLMEALQYRPKQLTNS
ncbi:MAG: ATP-binding protein [Candidatus Taylorbacteria bacterium]|nr:ATP-binding protein [Candidatus Taylorbacteria bacterium]